MSASVRIVLFVCLFRLSNSIPISSHGADKHLQESSATEKKKYLLNDVKTDVSGYLSNIGLVNNDDSGLYLSLPNSHLLKSVNLTVAPGSSTYNTAKVANLMLVGAAGYLLSYLPKEVFKSLIPPLENAQADLISNKMDDVNNIEYQDYFPDTMEDYLQPSASFIQPLAVKRRDNRRRKNTSEPGFFENIGNQIRSFFWPAEETKAKKRQASVKKDLSGGTEEREARFQEEDYYNEEDMENSEDEEIGFFKRVEKAIAGVFLSANPMSRASLDEMVEEETKEETEGGFFNSVNNFWTDNFSWDYGKFSPKNILVPSDQKLQRDKERKGEGLEEKTDNVGNLENEVFNEDFGYEDAYDYPNYHDNYLHVHMKADSSQKTASVLTPRVALMSDSMSPPPPPPLQLL